MDKLQIMWFIAGIVIIFLIGFGSAYLIIMDTSQLNLATRYCKSYGYDKFTGFTYDVFPNGNIANIVITCGKLDEDTKYYMGKLDFGENNYRIILVNKKLKLPLTKSINGNKILGT